MNTTIEIMTKYRQTKKQPSKGNRKPWSDYSDRVIMLDRYSIQELEVLLGRTSTSIIARRKVLTKLNIKNK